MSNVRPDDLIALALRSSARSAGAWTLEPASLRAAEHTLGRRTDRVLVGGAITFLILACIPAGLVGGAIMFVSAAWFDPFWDKAFTVLAYAIILLPAGNGLVLALWRAGHTWSGRSRHSFMASYGAESKSLLTASRLGLALSAVSAVVLVLTGMGTPS